MVNDATIQDFVDAFKTQPTETSKTLTATVARIDNEGTIWVNLYGSEKETPTEYSYVQVKSGDEVSLNWDNNKLTIVGNYSNPSIGADELNDAEIKFMAGIRNAAEEIVEEVVVGQYGIVAIWNEYNMSSSNATFVQVTGYEWSDEVPTFIAGYYIWRRTVYEYADGRIVYGDPEFSAQDQVLGEVKYAQDSTNNHFWSDNTGAYVTEDDEDYTTGYANRITSAGILQTYNNMLMSSWTNSGMVFYQSDGETPYVTYAPSGIINNPTTPFQIGNNNTYLKWVQENGTWKLKVQADVIEVGGDPVLTEDDRITIVSIEYAYQRSTSGSTIPTGTWSSSPLSPTESYYVWTRTTTTYSDGHEAVTYTVGGKSGTNGTNGTTITSTSVSYASQSASATGAGTTPPESGWTTSIPSVSPGDYLWTRTVVYFSDNTFTRSYTVARQGADGTDVTSQYMTWNSSTGLTIGYATYINSKINLKGDGFRIYNGNGYLGQYIHSSGTTIYNGASSPVAVAEFGGNNISLGKNALTSVISMCNDKLKFSASQEYNSAIDRYGYYSHIRNVSASRSDTYTRNLGIETKAYSSSYTSDSAMLVGDTGDNAYLLVSGTVQRLSDNDYLGSYDITANAYSTESKMFISVQNGNSTDNASINLYSVSNRDYIEISPRHIRNGDTSNHGFINIYAYSESYTAARGSMISMSADRVQSTVAITVTSDRRLKQHVDYLGAESCDFIRNLKPVVFERFNEKHLGFYAQDVKEVDAWNALTSEDDDYLALEYTGMIAPLVKYCQTLEKRIEKLEAS